MENEMNILDFKKKSHLAFTRKDCRELNYSVLLAPFTLYVNLHLLTI